MQPDTVSTEGLRWGDLGAVSSYWLDPGRGQRLRPVRRKEAILAASYARQEARTAKPTLPFPLLLQKKSATTTRQVVELHQTKYLEDRLPALLCRSSNIYCCTFML